MINKNSIFNLFIFSSLLLLSSCVDKIDPEIVKHLDEQTLEGVDFDKAIKKLTKDMTFGEALVSGLYYQHKKDFDMMIKCFERGLAVGGKQSIMQWMTMELAEAYLTQKDYEKSKKLANVYVNLYPGDKDAKRAAFVEINANYCSTYTADRDQKKTQETIDLIKAFQKNYGTAPDEQYDDKINEILMNCYNKKIESEIKIAETYIKRYKHFKTFSALNAAQKRIKYIKTDILPEIGIENARVNELDLYVDKNMRYELSKLVIHETLPETKSVELDPESSTNESL